MANPTQAGPVIAGGIDGMCLPPGVREIARKAKAEVQEAAAIEEANGSGDKPEPEIELAFLPEEFRHEIGDRVYILRDLKLIQQEEILRTVSRSNAALAPVAKDFLKHGAEMALARLVSGGLKNMIGALGEVAPQFFAIILIPEGEPLRSALKPITLRMRAEHFEENLAFGQEAEIIRDFFDLAKKMLAADRIRSEGRTASLKAHADKMKAEAAETL